MRFDRLITLGVMNPLLGARTLAGDRLPILMYHSISDTPEPGRSPYYRTVTSPAQFAAQMEFLHRSGWRALNVDQGLRALAAGTTSTEKLVVLTFDDGFRDFYTAAFPVLQKFGFSATMYLPTASIHDGAQPLQIHGHDCLRWREVRELHAAGIEFGSHTVSHPKLVNLSWPEIEREVADSKSGIEQQLGCKVSGFAYPYAFPQANRAFASRFVEALCQAGYENCVTTGIGRVKAGDDLFQLKRLPVNDADDAELFAAKLAGAYDWLEKPQCMVKQLKYWLGKKA